MPFRRSGRRRSRKISPDWIDRCRSAGSATVGSWLDGVPSLTTCNPADDTCVLTWDELEAIVGDLPPSASQYRAWWSGDRPQVRAWQAAGFRLADVSLGRSVTFARQTSARPTASIPPTDLKFEMPGRLEVEVEATTTASDIVLISCSKTKLDHPAAARDLYDSPLFRQSRAYAVASGRPWFILSAEHGLVGPDEWLAPYERYLPDTPAELPRRLGPLGGRAPRSPGGRSGGTHR